MSNVTFTNLPVATSLTGQEILAAVQNGGSVRVTANQLAALITTIYGPLTLKGPSTINAGTYTQQTSDASLIITSTNCVITLLAASSYPGQILFVKNITNNSLTSATGNVVPLGSATAGTAILSATAGKFAMLQSNGSNWVVMMAN
jgi:hypothetical protein